MLNPAPSKTKLCPEFSYIQQIQLANIYDLVEETPVAKLKKLSTRLGHELFLKREDLQPVHSFKLRGAHYKLRSLTESERRKGVIAASAGNHAQGVALSASSLGISAIIVMPVTTPEIKVQSVKNLGAEVVLHGLNFDEANQFALTRAEEQQLTFIPPFDDEKVIAGQGTTARELLQQLQGIDYVFIPVGGGGLFAGMAVYIKSLAPHVRVIAVEAEDSACFLAAMQQGEPVDLSHVGIFADGVAVRRIGTETFRVAASYCDAVVTVTSDEICAAIKDIFDDLRAIAEPAGALSLAGMKKLLMEGEQALAWSSDKAAMLSLLQQPSTVRASAILSGANMNFDNLRYVSERTEIGEKREAVLAVTIGEESGSFMRFCEALGGRVITEFNYRQANDKEAHVFVGIRLREGDSELKEILSLLREKGYSVQDLTHDETSKLHIRYMVGGVCEQDLRETVVSFEFPEYPGALKRFLTELGQHWNITMFHYRNHGAAQSNVLAGFEVNGEQKEAFFNGLKNLGYCWRDESSNLGYKLFLS